MRMRVWHSELREPTPAEITRARVAAGLAPGEAATLAELSGHGHWYALERGTRRVSSQTWTLFLLRTGQHPTQTLRRRAARLRR